ncbi:unnamed protein product [Umbelopsis ramanniana]
MPQLSRKTPISAFDVILPSLLYTIANYAVTKYLSVRAASIDVLQSWDPDFTLDLSGLAAFLGGDEAVSATVAAFSTGNIGWTGSYASPGAYAVAKYFGRTLEGKVWKACFPGERVDLSQAFRLHSPSNYQFYGLESFTKCRPYSNIPDCLVAELGKTIDVDKVIEFKTGNVVDVKLPSSQKSLPKKDEQLEVGTSALIHIFTVVEKEKSDQVQTPGVTRNVTPKPSGTKTFYKIPRSKSKAMYGLVALAVDSCKIERVKHKVSSNDTPPGHGIFAHDTENTFIAVFGTEDSVNDIAKTKLQVSRTNSKPEGTNNADNTYLELWTGMACMSMQLLFLAQILITPQGKLAGQIIFLLSLLVGWIANACYSYIDVTEAQRQVVQNTTKADHVLTLQGDRTQVLLLLAFLAGLHGDDFKEIYTNLLAKSADWKKALDAVSLKVSTKEGYQIEKGSISDRLKLAIEGAEDIIKNKKMGKSQKEKVEELMDFLQRLRKDPTTPISRAPSNGTLHTTVNMNPANAREPIHHSRGGSLANDNPSNN